MLRNFQIFWNTINIVLYFTILCHGSVIETNSLMEVKRNPRGVIDDLFSFVDYDEDDDDDDYDDSEEKTVNKGANNIDDKKYAICRDCNITYSNTSIQQNITNYYREQGQLETPNDKNNNNVSNNNNKVNQEGSKTTKTKEPPKPDISKTTALDEKSKMMDKDMESGSPSDTGDPAIKPGSPSDAGTPAVKPVSTPTQPDSMSPPEPDRT
ncbi:uncharacterized protein [Musca autumnalis]|uniref:uncharacterized protein n=1 Tax=Musca autumnalis TaxID=221902 RepID=UPI003CFB3CA3